MFFPGNCVADVAERFKVDEFGRVIGPREARNECLLVLCYAALEIIGNADVENAGSAGHDVNVEDHWWAILTGIEKVAIEERSLFGCAGVRGRGALLTTRESEIEEQRDFSHHKPTDSSE